MSSLSLTGEVLTRQVTDLVRSVSSELKGCTSATGRFPPPPFGGVCSIKFFADSLVGFGGEELLALLDKDNLDRGNICVDIPSFTAPSFDCFCGVSGKVTMSSKSSALIIVISPENILMKKKIGKSLF